MRTPTHSTAIGYIAWIFGVFGAHRFYYGKPISGVIWFFTLGLFGIGWIIDLFLIPLMNEEANQRFRPGPYDYSVAYLLLHFLGVFGLHRFYLGKPLTGILYLLTLGLFGFGIAYDFLTFCTQVDSANRR